MRVQSIAATLLVLFANALAAASCVQTPEANDAPSTVVDAPHATEVRDELGQTAEAMGRVPAPYGSKDFPFVEEAPDDHRDPAGGWQRSVASLSFVVTEGILEKVVYEWTCPVEIGMPLRCEHMGRISPSSASFWTADVANVATRLLLDSRPAEDWKGQGVVFCQELCVDMQRMLNAKHPGLGARVRHP